MIAIRPVPDDWDRWGQAGWAHDDILPALTRIERDVDFGTERYHGGDGPLPIFRMPMDRWGTVDRALWDACAAAGYPTCDDHNAPTGTGASPYAINANPETHGRVTANDAWLEPARDRANLTVVGGALVDRVLLDGGRAIGVRVRVDDEWSDVQAGEVLLTAGAVHSPAILLRSSIGPAAGLPVGDGLQDHANSILFIDYREGSGPETIDDRHTNCCLRYSSGFDEAGDNDMMVVTMNHSARRHPGGLLVAWVNQAFSRGALRLASHDPTEHPIIDENLLSHPSDLGRLRDATMRMIELTRQPAFEAISERISIDIRGTPVSELDADSALDDWLVPRLPTPSTSARRRPWEPSSTHDCRVFGYDNLRVVDASVFPEVPRANTHLMTLALADEMAGRLLS